MNLHHSKIIKLSGMMMLELLDIDVEGKIRFFQDGDKMQVIIEGSNNNGMNDEWRISLPADVMLEYIRNRYGIPRPLSTQLSTDEEYLYARFVVSIDTPIKSRKSAAPTERSSGSDKAAARKATGGNGRTGKKLSVLPGDLYPGE